MADKLNILFITADQWRGKYLSALGHEMVKTPNLDALAKEGVLFKKHYANAVPCAPSRASLHTGMYLQNRRSTSRSRMTGRWSAQPRDIDLLTDGFHEIALGG